MRADRPRPSELLQQRLVELLEPKLERLQGALPEPAPVLHGSVLDEMARWPSFCKNQRST